ncbi:MAG: formyltetrahydrofolate deformylase [Cyanobacteriota bacterium]|jgi:formyltetrahydrofolate deformylase
MTTATLLVSCPDGLGLVARLAHFIWAHNGNIIHADHHRDQVRNCFLSRLEWELAGFRLPREAIAPEFSRLAEELNAVWQLSFSDQLPRLSVWVSKQNHCLLDLLWRRQAGELRAEIPLIISNHPELDGLARQYCVDFYHLPITPATKHQQEERELELLEKYQIDGVILAKYMQVLSAEFIARFPSIINIHHSFLPAFPGANPYQRAYERGVKLIGATAHYVTEELDAGPIITQEVIPVSHRDSVADLIRKGRDAERAALSKAVYLHLENRVLAYGNRTVIFD